MSLAVQELAQDAAQAIDSGAEQLGTALDFLALQLPFYALACLFVGGLAALIHYKLLQPLLLRHLPPLLRTAIAQLASGLALALGLLLWSLLPGMASGGFSPAVPGYAPYHSAFDPGPDPGGGLLWGFFIFQGSFEELLFRGVAMALLALLIAWGARLALSFDADTPPAAHVWLWFWSGLLANLTTALAFSFVHAQNAHASPFALANIMLAGLLLGQLYWQQRSLWGACAFHVMWNAGQASLGIPVSGYLLRGPLIGSIEGAAPGALTGGQFGIEASLPLSIGLLATWLWLLRAGLAAAKTQIR